MFGFPTAEITILHTSTTKSSEKKTLGPPKFKIEGSYWDTIEFELDYFLSKIRPHSKKNMDAMVEWDCI